MSEIIDRIARIYDEGSFGEPLCKCEACAISRARGQEAARIFAVKVIAAMREPTENMVFVAGSDSMGFTAEDVRLGWQLMIDEALR